jgi:hypothetical protein
MPDNRLDPAVHNRLMHATPDDRPALLSWCREADNYIMSALTRPGWDVNISSRWWEAQRLGDRFYDLVLLVDREYAKGIRRPGKETTVAEVLRLLRDYDRQNPEDNPKGDEEPRPKRPGRRQTSDLKFDRDCYVAMKTGQYRTYKALGDAKGVTAEEAERAVDRQRQRLKRRRPAE